jgi:hypothetical protein
MSDLNFNFAGQLTYVATDKVDEVIDTMQQIKDALPSMEYGEIDPPVLKKESLRLEKRAVKLMDLCTEIASYIEERTGS